MLMFLLIDEFSSSALVSRQRDKQSHCFYASSHALNLGTISGRMAYRNPLGLMAGLIFQAGCLAAVAVSLKTKK